MNVHLCSKLDDIKVRYLSEHNEIKPSEATAEIIDVINKLTNASSIYGLLKTYITRYNRDNTFKVIDSIIIKELVETIYTSKTIDYTMYNFLQPEVNVIATKSTRIVVELPRVEKMYSLEKEIQIIVSKLGLVGLIEYVKLLLRYDQR